jgi:O-antigen ligase
MLDKNLEKLGFFGALGYIFFSVVPYAIAGKHIATGLMLIAFIGMLARKQIRNISVSWLSISIYLVLALAFLSAMLTPYAEDSLNQFRKDGVPFLLAFLLLLNSRLFDDTRAMGYVMLSLMCGYVVKEFLAIWAGTTNGFQFSIYEMPNIVMPKYLDFFSADTPYYLPFLLGPLFFWPMKLWQRLILLMLTAMAVVIVVISGVRTAFILVVMSLSLVVAYRFCHLKKTLFVMLCVLVASGYLLRDHINNPSIARYATILSTQTYQFGKDGSVSERYAIIKGVWEVSKDRLLLGYGPGWKKLPIVAEANGHMDRWRGSEKPIDKVALNYFSLGEGRVNPHNFYMATLFEEGLLGLIAYMSLMLAAGVGIFKMLIKTTNALQKGVAVAGALYLVVYLGGSISGGVWLPVTMLVMVVCLSIYQQKSRPRKI